MSLTISENMNYQSPVYFPEKEFSFFLQKSLTNEIFACHFKLPAKNFAGDNNINNQNIK